MEEKPTESADTTTAQSTQKVEGKTRDKWDKAEIVLQFIGAFGTAIVVGLVGIFGSAWLAKRQETENRAQAERQTGETRALSERQAVETNFRLYTELMSRREEADTSLRKEMFNSIITNFLKPASDAHPDEAVLNLELLAYNFHDSLDLGPLFKDEYRRLARNRRGNQPYIERLTKVTRDVIAKQVAMLREAGEKLDGSIDFAALKTEPRGVTVIDNSITVKLTDREGKETEKKVTVEVLRADPENQELEVRLIVRNEADATEADAEFTVDSFDFPMLDNLRLPEGNRCAIVLNSFDEESAELTFVYFPGSRAGLKEKPYYDEILHHLRPLNAVAASQPAKGPQR